MENQLEIKKQFVHESESGEEYDIDLVKVTCTCRDFEYRRKHHPIGNEERLCKHLWEYEEHLNIVQKQVPMDLDPDGKTRVTYEVAKEHYLKIIPSMILLQNSGVINKFEFCGSFRRMCDRVSDLDVLIVLNTGKELELEKYYDQLESDESITKRWRGLKKATYIINDFQIDFKIVPEESWYFATMHYTGSKAENIRLRIIANKLGYTLNEYGLFDESGTSVLQPTSEKDIYAYLGESFKYPQFR